MGGDQTNRLDPLSSRFTPFKYVFGPFWVFDPPPYIYMYIGLRTGLRSCNQHCPSAHDIDLNPLPTFFYYPIEYLRYSSLNLHPITSHPLLIWRSTNLLKKVLLGVEIRKGYFYIFHVFGQQKTLFLLQAFGFQLFSALLYFFVYHEGCEVRYLG